MSDKKKKEVESVSSTAQLANTPFIDIDAYAPKMMANRVGQVGISKANMGFLTTLALSILAGVFIALGAQLMMMVTHTATSSFGLNALVGGITFTMALVLIVITGAELFTGNCIIAMSYFSGKITSGDLTRNLVIAFIGNFIGALSIVFWIYFSAQWTAHNHLLGAKIVIAANDKVNLAFGVAFARGVLCNVLVCLGIWLCYSARNNVDKVLSLLWPIACLIACGFEHCVVNMWLIPMGLILKGNRFVMEAVEKANGGPLDISNLTCGKGFIVDNLVPVVLGNLFGGIILVAGVYWFVFLRTAKK
ncbi:MAG: formate/nitrite transporter family protein [Candidatus Scalindua sp.]|jgi:formate/nitrite transporter|nr:formate/nitrite transporter family protein [Candidatus Scalindua sp.]MDV5165851.1 formate/nitrite transporter family protein [Candidatus Scalindua sp.]